MSIDFGADLYEEPIVAKTFLSEDANEGSLRPHTLAEYIGQEKAKQNLAIFIEAARRRTESLDHVLLHGPPGLGKTTLAGLLSLAKYGKDEFVLYERDLGDSSVYLLHLFYLFLFFLFQHMAFEKHFLEFLF